MPRPRQTPDQILSRAEIQKAYRERQKQAREQELRQKGMPASPPIPSMPGTPRWTAMLDAARAQIETARDEMQSYYEERSEQWQEGEKGEAMQEQLERLEAAIEALQEAL
jgi:hypothetical protein